jgi:hypothetical protein
MISDGTVAMGCCVILFVTPATAPSWDSLKRCFSDSSNSSNNNGARQITRKRSHRFEQLRADSTHDDVLAHRQPPSSAFTIGDVEQVDDSDEGFADSDIQATPPKDRTGIIENSTLFILLRE